MTITNPEEYTLQTLLFAIEHAIKANAGVTLTRDQIIRSLTLHLAYDPKTDWLRPGINAAFRYGKVTGRIAVVSGRGWELTSVGEKLHLNEFLSGKFREAGLLHPRLKTGLWPSSW